MACCLTAPSHYLNQYLLIIGRSVDIHLIYRDNSAINHWNLLKKYLSKILFKSPRGQWVKLLGVMWLYWYYVAISDWCVWDVRCIFFHGCVSEMVVWPYMSSITYKSREHWDLVSIICFQSIDVQSMVFANDRIHYGLLVMFVCLQITPSHYHNYADSSEGIELIKCLSGICCLVCV